MASDDEVVAELVQALRGLLKHYHVDMLHPDDYKVPAISAAHQVLKKAEDRT